MSASGSGDGGGLPLASLWAAIGGASRTASDALSRAGSVASDLSSLQRRLGGLLSASALGYDLTANPNGYIKAVIIDWLVGGALRMVGITGLRIRGIWVLGSTIVADGLEAALSPLGTAGDSLASVILSMRDLVSNLATGMGPWGILVALAIGAALVILPAVLLRAGWELIT